MVNPVEIASHKLGEDGYCFVIAELGINHNGSLELAKKLIKTAKNCGADAVKFQKRTVEIVYSEQELAAQRESVFGTTNGDLKRGLEFGLAEYAEIDKYCKDLDILWTASCWDEDSVDFMAEFNPPFFKIASASLTDDDLLRHHRKYGSPILASTGMSSIEQVDHAVEVLGRDELVLLHCTSTYPTELEELNLNCIPMLMKRFGVPVGYSGHEAVFMPSFVAAMNGACTIERHLTLDRSLWGSDQAASLEPLAFQRLVKYIRALDTVLGDGVKKVFDSELPIIKKLRRK